MQLFFIHQHIYVGVSRNSANLDLSPLVDSLLSNEERSFTPFPLMKQTLGRPFLLASLLPRRKRFPLVSTAAGRTRACSSSLHTSARTHARTHVRTYAREYTRTLAWACILDLRVWGAVTTRRFRCMPEREVKGTPRANRFPSFPRHRPPKGVVSFISAT